MKKAVITGAIAVLLSWAAVAQDNKVAIFDPAGSVENSIREIVREEISSIIVNTGEYTVLERSLINKVLEENKFQSGGLVDDAQISEIGKRMGANMVFVSSLTIMSNGNYYISCKMIDVLTARIEKQKTAQTQKGVNDLVSVVQKMVGEMFANTVKLPEIPEQPSKPVVEEQSVPLKIVQGMLTADGKKVYQDGQLLTKDEVRGLMANTDALRLYNKSISRNRNGNIWLISGLCLFAGGIIIYETVPFYHRYSYYYDDYYGYYDDYSYDDSYTIGTLCMIAGGAMTITGVTLKLTSKGPIRQSVDMYNSRKSNMGMELKFGLTGNGVGLALVF